MKPLLQLAATTLTVILLALLALRAIHGPLIICGFPF